MNVSSLFSPLLDTPTHVTKAKDYHMSGHVQYRELKKDSLGPDHSPAHDLVGAGAGTYHVQGRSLARD